MTQPQEIYNDYINFFIDYYVAVMDDLPTDEEGVTERFNKLLNLKKNYPGNAAVYDALGVGACVLKKKEDSIKFHKAALRLDPNNSKRYYNFSISLKFLGELKEAQVYINKAINLNPENPVYHVTYLQELEMEGEIDKAIDYVAKLIKDKFPNNKELQEIHEDLVDYDQVVTAMDRANDPASSYVPFEKAVEEFEI